MKNSTMPLPVFLISTTAESKRIKRLVAAGKLRQVQGRLHTSDLSTPLDVLCKRHRWEIVALLCPGAVVCQKSGLDRAPAADGSMFVSGEYSRVNRLPGIVIRQIKTAGPIEGDLPFIGGLFLASEARAALENLATSRGRGMAARTAGRKAVEDLLVGVLRRGGERELNDLRDLARRIATTLDAGEQMAALDGIVGALLSTHEVKLISPRARAAAAGHPYDAARVARFDALANALRRTGFEPRPTHSVTQSAFVNEAFFDAYFSNYIEGTKFPVGQAIDIVFHGAIPAQRPADAHDIRGTFRVVGNPVETRRKIESYEDFEAVMRARHAQIMAARVETGPGLIKSVNNEAGSTLFVPPGLVLGTLRKGWEFMPSLVQPLARALFMMFLVSETHPFQDGNGRAARAMMNGELLQADETRILIPSVFRNDYLAGLKLLTNHDDPSAYIRIMDRAQLFVSRIAFDDLDAARETLRRCWAFEDPSDVVQLRIPAEDGTIDERPLPKPGGGWLDALSDATGDGAPPKL